jgi:hypothetical protein
MRSRLVIVTRAISLGELDKIDARASVIALTGEATTCFDGRMLERWTRRSAMAIAIAPQAPAVALLSDFFALSGMTVDRDSLRGADALAGLTWRLGSRLRRILALEPDPIAAARALELGICDALVEPQQDPLHWLDLWIGNRSLAALASAARLTRTGRSESGERIEFARLFSTGEPQSGLRSFLNKTKLDFTSSRIVETI